MLQRRRAEDTAFKASAVFSSPESWGRKLGVPYSRPEEEQKGQQYIRETFVTPTIYTAKAFKSMIHIKEDIVCRRLGQRNKPIRAKQWLLPTFLLSSYIHVYSGLFTVPFTDGWVLGMSPASTLKSVRTQLWASLSEVLLLQCPGQDMSESDSCPSSVGTDERLLCTVAGHPSRCWVSTGCYPSAVPQSGKLWGGTNQSYLSLACAVTSHGQKPIKDKRNPGTWRCYLHW